MTVRMVSHPDIYLYNDLFTNSQKDPDWISDVVEMVRNDEKTSENMIINAAEYAPKRE